MASALPLRARHGRPGSRPSVPKRLLALRGDEALVAAVRRGDDAAFEILFDRYSGKILSFCRHMLGSREAAEDAAQQAFISAYTSLQSESREINFKPWLYTIARNRCLSTLRAGREDPVAELETQTVGLQNDVQSRADLRELLADLHDLPDDQRAALVLAELGDLSHTEIGEVLGTEASNVKGLVFRARSGLIERREAREQPCEEVQARLSNLRGGALRAGALRHHLKACPACTAYLDDVRRQRKLLALVLPVAPTLGFKRSALASVGIVGSAGGAVGGVAATAAALKVAAVLAVAGGGAVATEQVITDSRGADPTPAAEDAQNGVPRPGLKVRETTPAGPKPETPVRKGRDRAARDPRGKAIGLERAKDDGRPAAPGARGRRFDHAPSRGGNSGVTQGTRAPSRLVTPPPSPTPAPQRVVPTPEVPAPRTKPDLPLPKNLSR